MRQYKDSGIEWIGRIPETWEVTAIKRLFFLYAGATPKSDEPENWDGDIPWITPADYQTEDRYISGGKRSISQKGMDSCATTMLPVNSIIFSKRAPIGLVVINTNPLCTNQGCIGCVPKDSIVSKYFYFAMSVFTEQFELYGAGTTFKEISATNFGNFIIVAPPISDQQRIADYLDLKCGEIDSLIGLQEQMIEKLKAYKQSVITEAVTKGLDPNAKLVSSGIDWIGEIPEGWTKDKVIRCFHKIGSGTTPKSTDDNLFQGNINWLQSGDINGGNLYEASKHISEQTLASYSALSVYQAPFIIIAMYGASVGNISMSHVDACVNQACCVLSGSNLNFNYAFYALKSAKPYLIYRAEGGGQPNISQDKLKTLWIPRPPMDEQRSIAAYLDEKCADIDRLIALKQQKIEALKDYKKSIIYEAVTGKTIIE